MKLFNCIIDDGKNVFKTLTAAKSKKELLKVYGGNGTFEKIQDITNDYLCESSVDQLNEDLMLRCWGEAERKIICALVRQHIESK